LQLVTKSWRSAWPVMGRHFYSVMYPRAEHLQRGRQINTTPAGH